MVTKLQDFQPFERRTSHMGWVAHFPPTLQFIWIKYTLCAIKQDTNRYTCEVLRDGSQRLEEGRFPIEAREMKVFMTIHLYMV